MINVLKLNTRTKQHWIIMKAFKNMIYLMQDYKVFKSSSCAIKTGL